MNLGFGFGSVFIENRGFGFSFKTDPALVWSELMQKGVRFYR